MYIRHHSCTLFITAAVFRLQPITTLNDYMKLKPMVLKTKRLVTQFYFFGFLSPVQALH